MPPGQTGWPERILKYLWEEGAARGTGGRAVGLTHAHSQRAGLEGLQAAGVSDKFLMNGPLNGDGLLSRVPSPFITFRFSIPTWELRGRAWA